MGELYKPDSILFLTRDIAISSSLPPPALGNLNQINRNIPDQHVRFTIAKRLSAEQKSTGPQVFLGEANWSSTSAVLVGKIFDPLDYCPERQHSLITPSHLEAAAKDCLQEVAAYQTLHTRVGGVQIARFYGSWTLPNVDTRPVKLILIEYIPSLTMDRFDPQTFSEEQRSDIMINIIVGYVVMLHLGVRYSTVSPKNILIRSYKKPFTAFINFKESEIRDIDLTRRIPNPFVYFFRQMREFVDAGWLPKKHNAWLYNYCRNTSMYEPLHGNPIKLYHEWKQQQRNLRRRNLEASSSDIYVAPVNPIAPEHPVSPVVSKDPVSPVVPEDPVDSLAPAPIVKTISLAETT